MTDLVSIVIACADAVRHLDTSTDEEGELISPDCQLSAIGLTDGADQPSERLVSLLQGGLVKVKSLAPETGDPHLRVEKYLLRQVRAVPPIGHFAKPTLIYIQQYERKGDWIAIDALLASLAQSYPTSALLLITRTEYLLFVSLICAKL
jgi:hypothetical protein